MTFYPQWRSALSTSIMELLLLFKFDNSGTQWNPFNYVYLLFKFDVSSFSVTGDILIFKLVILLILSNSKLIFILLTFYKSNWPYLFFSTDFGQVKNILLSLGKTPWKTPKNFRTLHRIWHKPFSMIKSEESRTISSVYAESSKVQFFSFCNTIFWFLGQNKIFMIRIKTKSFTELGKYLLNGYLLWQYCQEPNLEPNQKSMVELFCKNS